MFFRAAMGGGPAAARGGSERHGEEYGDEPLLIARAAGVPV